MNIGGNFCHCIILNYCFKRKVSKDFLRFLHKLVSPGLSASLSHSVIWILIIQNSRRILFFSSVIRNWTYKKIGVFSLVPMTPVYRRCSWHQEATCTVLQFQTSIPLILSCSFVFNQPNTAFIFNFYACHDEILALSFCLSVSLLPSGQHGWGAWIWWAGVRPSPSLPTPEQH